MIELFIMATENPRQYQKITERLIKDSFIYDSCVLTSKWKGVMNDNKSAYNSNACDKTIDTRKGN